MTLTEYLQLLDWTDRQIRHDGKLRTIPPDLMSLLEQVGSSAELWVDCVKRFGMCRASVAPRP